MDVICVYDDNGMPHCTDFHVKFKSPLLDDATIAVLGLSEDAIRNTDQQDSVFPVVSPGEIEQAATRAHMMGQAMQRNDFVQIQCNDKIIPEITAFIGEELFLHFLDREDGSFSKTPSASIINKLELKMGKNSITCIHFGSTLVKEFNIWRFDKNQQLVIMDIDGTITKSDITGYIQTVYMGMFSYIHDGIVPFLNSLKDAYKYAFIYLTARPLIHQKETRQLLQGIKDGAFTMPDGPLFPSKDRMMVALYREMISKTTMQLKTEILTSIKQVFLRAGCRNISPFALGIGNKEADALAYNLAGLNAENILLIDKQSRIEVWKYKQLLALPSKPSNKLTKTRSIPTESAQVNNTAEQERRRVQSEDTPPSPRFQQKLFGPRSAGGSPPDDSTESANFSTDAILSTSPTDSVLKTSAEVNIRTDGEKVGIFRGVSRAFSHNFGTESAKNKPVMASVAVDDSVSVVRSNQGVNAAYLGYTFHTYKDIRLLQYIDRLSCASR